MLIIQAIQDKVQVPWQVRNIIFEIKGLLAQCLQVTIQHIYRETNMWQRIGYQNMDIPLQSIYYYQNVKLRSLEILYRKIGLGAPLCEGVPSHHLIPSPIIQPCMKKRKKKSGSSLWLSSSKILKLALPFNFRAKQYEQTLII